MKPYILFFLLFISVSVFGQFPEPTNFQFSYQYISIGNVVTCGGETLVGPGYCSYFSWEEPDLSLTNATLDHYVIYYVSDYDPTTFNIIATTTNTSYEMEIGIMGVVWVTAVYTEPDGESQASNTVENHDLPISIEQTMKSNKNFAYYDKNNELLRIQVPDKIFQIKIFTSSGALVQRLYNQKQINMSSYPTGLYIVEILLNNQEPMRYKIIKQ